MPDPRVTSVADVLVHYSTGIQPGDLVFIGGSTEATPLLHSVYEKVLAAGGYPNVIAQLPSLQEYFFEQANDDQLTHISPIERLVMEEYDATITIGGAVNTKALSNVEAARQAKHQAARRELTQTFMRRSAEGSLRWVSTLFPTNAYAQDAEMGLREYESFVYGACLVDAADPVAAWREVSGRQARLVAYLSDKSEVHVVSEDTDLVLSIEGRTFVNADGKHNFPDGEIFTGPVEDSVNGVITFDFPAIIAGREVEGVQLHFEDGRVVEATARKNEAFLHEMLKTDGGASYLGEFAFGTNYGIQQFTRSTLFDEKIGGTIHLALGAGYPETGSQNESALHWDMVCDIRQGGEVRVDGELFQKDGQFVVAGWA